MSLRDTLARRAIGRYRASNPSASEIKVENWVPDPNDLADEIEKLQERISRWEVRVARLEPVSVRRLALRLLRRPLRYMVALCLRLSDVAR